jgi:PPOX class probable F420-dependent enzyme
MAELSDEVIDFLSAGTRTAMLGYLAADGRPLVAPVWFVVDNGELVFNTERESAKGRALARDSRVVICVDDPHPPYSFVQVQGIASVHDGAEDLLEIATRIGGRYMGADRADEFGRRNTVSGELVVRVQPTKVSSAFNVAGGTRPTSTLVGGRLRLRRCSGTRAISRPRAVSRLRAVRRAVRR